MRSNTLSQAGGLRRRKSSSLPMWSVRSLPIWMRGTAPGTTSPNRHRVAVLLMDTKVEQLLSKSRSLYDKFEQCSESHYIDKAIAFDREALDICTPGHPKRSPCLVALSWHIWTRYKQLGGIENINEAIVLGQEALVLCPPGHPYRSSSLVNLAVYLWGRYKQLGGVDDLDEAIRLDREALVLCPPGHPSRSVSLNSLAVDLFARYNELGSADDLNEAICLDRDALVLRPPGHPDRSMSLNSFAIRLWTRYNNLGGVDDLDEAICLDREALALRPPGHPDRSSSLNNLAADLFTRYNKLGGVDDLNEAICLDREALALRPPGHPNRSMSLNNLAIHLWTRYNSLDGVDDLEEAISLDRDALALRPPGHPDQPTSLNNLAADLFTRYSKLGEAEDLNEAIRLDREALVLRPPGNPYRPSSLHNLAAHLSSRYKKFHEAEDREEIFCLYSELSGGAQAVSSDSLSVAKAWVNAAENFHHTTTCLAYETTLRLLVHHLAVLPSLPRHLTVLKDLSSSLAVDAFSACLRSQSPITAVELLEQGRGVFWSQLTRLRSPLNDIVTSGPGGNALANEFTRLTSFIRDALNSPGADQHDRVWRLNLELQKVVSNIRDLPGHSRFLLPLRFSDLRRAASSGPVIIVNASKYGCDALVVFADKDPIHIPLSVTKDDVQGLSSKLNELTMRAKRSIVTKDIGVILRELWGHVVSPIAEFLRTTYPPQSRIWWCPTAEFSLLPLHAAGSYRKGQHNFADLYISSYTPTLSALIRARLPRPSSLAMEQSRFLCIGQAKASGENELLSVSTELVNVGQQVDGRATFMCIEGEESCISRVTEELGKSQWVHLACHGIPNKKQPLDSAFALHDGDFTIQHIIRCDLKDPEFAYLSACHTTVGDEECPDEVIHLACAMQFAGFRSVIGTMWAVDDAQTIKITSEFYAHMIDESGRLDHTRAAYALWKTMRTVDVPFDQHVLYVHIGA